MTDRAVYVDTPWWHSIEANRRAAEHEPCPTVTPEPEGDSPTAMLTSRDHARALRQLADTYRRAPSWEVDETLRAAADFLDPPRPVEQAALDEQLQDATMHPGHLPVGCLGCTVRRALIP